MSFTSIELSQAQWQEMENHVRMHMPQEACGLLAGLGGHVHWTLPITNIEDDPNRFRMDPQEQLDSMIKIEDDGLELIGVYHSHPHGPEGLSIKDVEAATFLDVAHLVWSPCGDKWFCKAFIIERNTTREILIHVN